MKRSFAALYFLGGLVDKICLAFGLDYCWLNLNFRSCPNLRYLPRGYCRLTI